MEMLKKALELHTRGEIDKARELYLKIIEEDPNNASCLNNLGLIETQKGNIDKGIEYIRKAININKNFAEAYNNLGVILGIKGKMKEAITCFKQALSIKRNYPEAWQNLADAFLKIGMPNEAIAAVSEALKLNPESASCELIYANALIKIGRFQEAVIRFRRALAIEPRNKDALVGLIQVFRTTNQHKKAEVFIRKYLERFKDWDILYNLLGVILHDQGKYEEAIEAFENAIFISNNIPEFYNNKAASLKAMHKFSEAEECIKKALELNPNYPEALNNYGTLLTALRRFDEAIEKYKKAIEIRPNFLEAHINLALCLAEKGETKKAKDQIEDLLRKDKDSPILNKAMGIILVKLEKYEEAEDYLRKALRSIPNDPELLSHLGSVVNWLGFEGEAEELLKRALNIDPNLVGALNELGNIYASLGREEEAKRCFFKAIEISQYDPAIIRNMSSIYKFTKDDALFNLLKNLENKELPPEKKVELFFALSKAYEDIGEEEKSFEAAIEANKIKRSLIRYDIREIEQQINTLIKVFTPEFVRRYKNSGYPSRIPIFIIGMPRSGTTLVEQILSAHPDVYGAGELKLMKKSIGYGIKFGNIIIDALDSEEESDLSKALPPEEGFFEIGKRYIRELRLYARDAKRITDKMPGNFMNLGIILLSLPEATVIHVKRNPLDTCVSCFKTHFAEGQEWSYDLTELGRYYCSYAKIMEHWKKLFPKRIIEISYEELINDFENQVKKLVQACGLSWNESCLKFYEVKRPVKTASLSQVRKPIYGSSIGKWKRYRKYLDPLIKILSSENIISSQDLQ